LEASLAESSVKYSRQIGRTLRGQSQAPHRGHRDCPHRKHSPGESL